MFGRHLKCFKDLLGKDILFMKDKMTSISKNNKLAYKEKYKAENSMVVNFYNKLEDIIREDYKEGILIEDEYNGTDTIYKPVIERCSDPCSGTGGKLSMGFNIKLIPIMSVNADEVVAYKEKNSQQVTNENTDERNSDE